MTRYVVQAGDSDLQVIAFRLLGDPDRWTEIAALNGIRDPLRITAGQILLVPED